MEQTIKKFEDTLDEETGTKPKKRTPEEMKQSPNIYLDELEQENRAKPVDLPMSEGQGKTNWGTVG